MLADMLAVKSGRVTKNMLLGVQVFYSVPKRGVKRTKLHKEWVSEGLDTLFIPEEVKPNNVFMRACDSVKTGRRGVRHGDHITEVLPEHVTSGNGHVVYQITRIVRNLDDEVIDHPKAMTLKFDKATHTIMCIPRDRESYAALRDIEDQVRDYYHRNAELVPGDRVRAAVRETVLSLGATPLAERAAIYFVPIEHANALDALQNVLSALYGDDAYLHTIPWLNTDATQEIIERHHTANVQERINALTVRMHEMMGRTNGVKLRKDAVQNSVQESVEIARAVKKYRDLLGREVGVVNEALNLMQDQVERLMDHAVVDAA